MVGYRDDDALTADAMRDGYYHTGDVASRDADGYITYVGRSDDVFKASDYRISPFELESVLIEHPAVAEAAVVPAPDPLRLAVPKAYVVLAAGCEPIRRDGARNLGVRARAPGAVQAHPPPGVRRSARRRSPARSAGSSCGRPRRVTTRGPPVNTATRTSPTSRPDCQRRSRTTCPQPFVDSRAPDTPRNWCVGVHKGGARSAALVAAAQLSATRQRQGAGSEQRERVPIWGHVGHPVQATRDSTGSTSGSTR